MNSREALRVVVVHNAYQQRGGEDSVVRAEIDLLRQRGHEVELYSRDNAELACIGSASAAVQAIWSTRTHREVSELMARLRPDVIHVHNSVPLISPSVYWAAAKRNVPVVQTLHNFRLVCPQATLLRNGKICEDCVGKVPWRGVARACYRGSVAQTAVLAGANALHGALGTWSNKVARYIALTEFARDKFVAGGLPAERISVKPNFVDLADLPEVGRSGALFVGRLSEEKGIDTLLAAVRMLPPGNTVRVVGDGPMAGLVAAEPRIEWLGQQSSDAVYALMRQAQFLILPSICYDNFPRTLVEAYASGLPVLASDLGPLRELVVHEGTGLLIPAGDAPAWASTMQAGFARTADMTAMGRRARAHYARELNADSNYRQLMNIYEEALQARA